MYIDVVQVNSSPGPNADHTPQNFFISRFIEDQENIEVLDPSERLYERWEDLLHDERNKLEERLSTFENSIGERLTDVLFESIEREMGIPRRGPKQYHLHGHIRELMTVMILVRLLSNLSENVDIEKEDEGDE